MDVMIYATEVVRKLRKAGYLAYFAGGWVRDYLMKHPSSDIDIATDAPPEVILDIFPKTILVGLAFGVIIVIIEGHKFEVSTFRRDISYLNGRKPEKIELSTPEEDARRRDFTINGMFYDPLEDRVYDYVHGMADLANGIIRAIGDPYERFFEDRLRMIRAVRFACRFDFLIDPETQEGIIENADTLIPAVAMERIWQEFNKMAQFPRFDKAIIEMHRFGLLPVIFPSLKETHLKEIKQHVQSFRYFPTHTPTILYLAQVFPSASLEEFKEITHSLHTSNNDLRILENFLHAKEMVRNRDNFTDVDWVHFYALEYSEIYLAIIAAHDPQSREQFLNSHHEQKSYLKKHVDRVIKKNPLLNGKLLRSQGIPEGKLIGDLVREAEKMAILCNIDFKEELLEKLKHSPLWPKKEI